MNRAKKKKEKKKKEDKKKTEKKRKEKFVVRGLILNRSTERGAGIFLFFIFFHRQLSQY